MAEGHVGLRASTSWGRLRGKEGLSSVAFQASEKVELKLITRLRERWRDGT